MPAPFTGKWVAVVGNDAPQSAQGKHAIDRIARSYAAQGIAGVVCGLSGWSDQAAIVAFREAKRSLPIVGISTGRRTDLDASGIRVASLCTEVLEVCIGRVTGPFVRPTVDGAVLSMARTKGKGSANAMVLALTGVGGAYPEREWRMMALARIWRVAAAETVLAMEPA